MYFRPPATVKYTVFSCQPDNCQSLAVNPLHCCELGGSDGIQENITARSKMVELMPGFLKKAVRRSRLKEMTGLAADQRPQEHDA